MTWRHDFYWNVIRPIRFWCYWARVDWRLNVKGGREVT